MKKKRSAETEQLIVGGWYAALVLVHLKPANILSRRRIGRPPEEGCEAAHDADVVTLSIGS